MEYHYLYQIVSLVPDENGVCKIYSGVRSSEVEPEIDDYFGSGRRLKAAVKKHGRDKFIKTIVAKFDTREAAYDCETVWLEKLFTKFYGGDWTKFNRHHYNLRLNENRRDGNYCSDETRKKMGAANVGRIASPEVRLKMSIGRSGEKHPLYGKKHSSVSKMKMREAQLGKTHSEASKRKLSEASIGTKSAKFLGITIGLNRANGQTIAFDGNSSMKDRKFHPGEISSCVSGRKQSHKNFTFTRSTDENYLRQLLEEDNFHDEQSKVILQNFLQ